VVGASRKSFLGTLTGREVGERLGGTIAANVLALAAGAEVLRVHDVAELRQALDVAETILGRRAWERPAPVASA
jgi:dihydropteroate synthase